MACLTAAELALLYCHWFLLEPGPRRPMKGMAEDSHKTDYFLKTCIRHYVFKTKLTGFYHLSIMLFVSNHEIEGEGRLMCLEFIRITIVIRGLQIVLFMQILSLLIKPNQTDKAKKTVCITLKLLLISIFFFY